MAKPKSSSKPKPRAKGPRMEKVNVPKRGVKLTRPAHKPRGIKPVEFKTADGKNVKFLANADVPKSA